MSKFAMLGLGYGFIVLGLLGLVLPFLQGILFLLVGLLILSRHAHWAERLLGRIKGRHPSIARTIVIAEEFTDRTLDRLAGFFKRFLPGR